MICCYYPTTTVAIDDDSNFLNILTKHSGITNCKGFTSPQNAIIELKNNTSLSRLQERVIKAGARISESDSTPEDHTVSYALHNLHEEIYNKSRFNDVSVIVVDYYMNEVNGIDVCEALKDHPAKKILLTGGADKESLAKEDYQHPASMWNQFFYQCQPMTGATDYYYAIFHGRQNQHIDKDRITPYTAHNPASGVNA